jgi:DNA helicase-2/ATP-dependent DNA helicase PcrA
VRSGVRFFEQKHVKDVVSFLRIAENRADELAFLRVATLVPGLGRATAQKLFETVRSAPDPAAALRSREASAIVGARARGGWEQMSELIAELHAPAMRDEVAKSIGYVVDRFYSAYADREFDNAPNRLRDLEQLAVYAEQQGTVGDFLDQLTLSGVIAGRDLVKNEETDDAVVLSTVHQAKGLEFHAVFILWVAEERFPPAWSESDSENLEEERRLFYVALTRAEHELALVSPMTARERGGMRVAVRWSPFADEVRHKVPPLLETWKLRRG